MKTSYLYRSAIIIALIGLACLLDYLNVEYPNWFSFIVLIGGVAVTLAMTLPAIWRMRGALLVLAISAAILYVAFLIFGHIATAILLGAIIIAFAILIKR